MKQIQGISLTELLISLCISILLMSALSAHYLFFKEQYRRVSKNLAETYELQLITDLIRDSIKASGFTPCLGINHLVSPKGQNLQAMLVQKAAFKVSHMSERFTQVTEILAQDRLLVPKFADFTQGRAFMIADCMHAEVHRLLDAQKTSKGLQLTLEAPLIFSYVSPIYIGEWLEESFLMKKNNRGELALFYQTLQKEELSTFVQDLSTNWDGRVLQVVLKLRQGEDIVLETRLRTP